MQKASWVLSHRGYSDQIDPVFEYETIDTYDGTQSKYREGAYHKCKSGKDRNDQKRDSLLSSQYHREKSALQEITARREAEKARDSMALTRGRGREIMKKNGIQSATLKGKKRGKTKTKVKDIAVNDVSQVHPRGITMHVRGDQRGSSNQVRPCRRIDIFSGSSISVKDIY